MTQSDNELLRVISEAISVTRPDDTEDMNAIIPAAAWRRIVDAHAAAMYERAHPAPCNKVTPADLLLVPRSQIDKIENCRLALNSSMESMEGQAFTKANIRDVTVTLWEIAHRKYPVHESLPADIVHDAKETTNRPCTCDPADNPPQPCPEKYALSECRAAASDVVHDSAETEIVRLIAKLRERYKDVPVPACPVCGHARNRIGAFGMGVITYRCGSDAADTADKGEEYRQAAEHYAQSEYTTARIGDYEVMQLCDLVERELTALRSKSFAPQPEPRRQEAKAITKPEEFASEADMQDYRKQLVKAKQDWRTQEAKADGETPRTDENGI